MSEPIGQIVSTVNLQLQMECHTMMETRVTFKIARVTKIRDLELFESVHQVVVEF